MDLGHSNHNKPGQSTGNHTDTKRESWQDTARIVRILITHRRSEMLTGTTLQTEYKRLQKLMIKNGVLKTLKETVLREELHSESAIKTQKQAIAEKY